jgi:translation elongation factor EF-G
MPSENTVEITITAPMESMGEISRIIQSRKGDFLSIDQKNNSLVVIARVKVNEKQSITEDLEEALGNSFSIETLKES